MEIYLLLKLSDTNTDDIFSLSELISNGHPPIMKIIPSAENLQIVSIRHESLSHIIDLLRFLGLASPHVENHVSLDVEEGLLSDITFDADQAGFLCMLEVVAMALGNLTVNCLLDPGNLVNQGVTILVHHFDCEAVLGVDHPNEKETGFLNLVEWHLHDVLVC